MAVMLKEDQTKRGALLLEGLSAVRRESADIQKKWLAEPTVAIDDIYLPPDVWVEILAEARQILIDRIRDVGIELDLEEKS